MSVLKSVTHILYVWSGSLIYLQFILDSMIMHDCANDLTCYAFLIFYGMDRVSVWYRTYEASNRRSECLGVELIGPDCDPVYSICPSTNTVYTACREAKIRKYILKQTEIPTS